MVDKSDTEFVLTLDRAESHPPGLLGRVIIIGKHKVLDKGLNKYTLSRWTNAIPVKSFATSW